MELRAARLLPSLLSSGCHFGDVREARDLTFSGGRPSIARRALGDLGDSSWLDSSVAQQATEKDPQVASTAAPRAGRVGMPSPPNVLVVYLDDVGIGDVGASGFATTRVATPHMDRLASEGVRFTRE